MQRFYEETRNRVRYEINGAHRGGRDHSQLLLDKVLASPEAQMPEVSLRDLRADRTQELAHQLERQGVSVTVHHEEAQPESKTAVIRVLAIDDAKRVAREVDKPVKGQVMEVGIIVAAATVERLGGSVIGLGTTLTPNAKEVIQQARPLFGTIADMTEERHSSRNMSASIVNFAQMDRTRRQVHDRLTDSSLDYLERGAVSPDIFAIDGLTSGVFPLEVVETQRDTRRQDLKDLVTHEILPQVMEAEDRAGVAFYDRQDPWLYIVFARKSGAHWRTANIVELPTRVLAPVAVPIRTPVEERPHKTATTWSQTWVTD